MGRPRRPELGEAVFHVFSKCGPGLKIFAREETKDHFFNILERVKESFQWRCHAYCLLEDAYHLPVMRILMEH